MVFRSGHTKEQSLNDLSIGDICVILFDRNRAYSIYSLSANKEIYNDRVYISNNDGIPTYKKLNNQFYQMACVIVLSIKYVNSRATIVAPHWTLATTNGAFFVLENKEITR